MNIILGITGGIAAYKCADIASILVKEGFCVKTVMTENAKKFITPLTMATMSKNPVYDDSSEWAPDGTIKHIELAKWCDIFVIVPATANTIAKIANGIANNLLTSAYLALTPDKAVLICPAMNTCMWKADITQENLRVIRGGNRATDTVLTSAYKSRFILPPEEGMLACGDIGMGKLTSVQNIVGAIKSFFGKL